MVWQPEIEELEHRKKLAEQMGGEENIARHHARGKLTVRERLAVFADPESFEEIGALTGTATYDSEQKLETFSPQAFVVGVCSLDGRKVIVNGGDFTIRGGSGGYGPKGNYAEEMAEEWRLPYVRLLDASGGSVRQFEAIGRTYAISNVIGVQGGRLLGMVPVASAVMGSVAGIPAIEACISHFSVMVKGTSQVFPGGPPVVKAALGVDITKEELGDERTQVRKGGVIDNLAENEEEALGMIRQFLSYLPSSVWEMPPRVESADDPERRDEELLSAIPRDKRKLYDPHAILDHVMDRDSFFEIGALYGRSRIIGLARLNGYPVGVMINNPKHQGAAMNMAAGLKVVRFLKLCDTFHLPMVYLADEPGFMVGLEAQKQGIVRAGARLVHVTGRSRMPWITIVIRQLYGVAGQLNLRPSGMYKRYAWPSGNWGSMHIQGGTYAAYRREIDNAPDPDAKLAEIENRLQALASPFRTAETFSIEDIIDPRDTRKLLVDFVDMAQRVVQSQLGPTMVPVYEP
ncbi:MAG: carboxyl transferase domain-containing protein [Pseudomonadales bacterium]|jgi:acetyl-CoA carboxylase carboxyltransferase component|nr:carboxyl transferase domain-containing protein [Pseudomonadales bacterium]HJN49608.1 carboxyl transferase domain-containing protein [Pseudomonadales bacterium]